jgi:N-acetylmuramoyl-L-alanine amidase
MIEVLSMKHFLKWVSGYAVILLSALLIARLGSHAVTVMAENRPVEGRHTMIIDPGHGGVDGGATSCTGLLESRFNLEIGLRLEAMLQFLGCRTVMIRREDVSVYTEGETIAGKKASDLKQRVRMAEDEKDAVLLSIHQNYFPQAQYSGAQAFYAGTAGSRSLAKAMQTAFTEYLKPARPRQEKKSSGVYLMEHVSCPAVLIECGFLSNPREEALLRTPNYQKKLAVIIGCTAAEYLSNT